MMSLLRFIRPFRKGEQTATLLSVIGLALAFTSVYLLLNQSWFDLTYNRFLRDSHRIFRFELRYSGSMRWSTCNSEPLIRTLVDGNPTIESYSQGSNIAYPLQITLPDGSATGILCTRATKESCVMFGYRFLEGNFGQCDDGGIIISHHLAKRCHFRMGDSITIKGIHGQRYQKAVAAIYADFPRNTSPSEADAIQPMEEDVIKNTDWSEANQTLYVKLHAEVDTTRFLQYAVRRMKANGACFQVSEMRLSPITSIHFNRDTYTTGEETNRSTAVILLAVAILIFAISFINFFNYFLSLVPRRIRTINTRKIYGASVRELRAGVLLESLLLVSISMALAGLLVQGMKDTPLAAWFSIPIGLADNVTMVLVIIILGWILAIASSISSAWILTSKPLSATVGRSRFAGSKGGRRLRYTLLGVEYFITITLITVSIFVWKQYRFMLHHDMGFDTRCVLQVNVNDPIGFSSKNVMVQGIADVTTASNALLNDVTQMVWGRTLKRQSLDVQFQAYPVHFTFLRFFHIPITAGRDFTAADDTCENGAFIFNETARRRYGLTLSDSLNGIGKPTRIVGFCRDFHFESVRDSIVPFAFYVTGRHSMPNHELNYLYLRLRADADTAVVARHLRQTIINSGINPENIHISSFHNLFPSLYEKEKHLSWLVTFFSVVTIFISLMGLVSLTLIEARYRQQEIALRRAMGAETGSIIRMFSSRFVRIILACAIIATPAAWLVLHFWLQAFASCVPLSPWPFMAAPAAVLFLTVIVLTATIWRTAHQRPTDVLRKE